MVRDKELKIYWNTLEDKLSKEFNDNQPIDLDAIIYLIGIQELGILDQKFKKDDKINVMHISICTLLEPYGYYEFKHRDSDGWPHFELKEELPPLKAGEQSLLIKQAIVEYFLKNNFIDK